LKVRVLIIGDNRSFHTYRWFNSYKRAGFEVRAVGLEEGESLCERIKAKGKGKLKYLFSLPALQRVVVDFKPDLIHAQMAGNYGLMASFIGKPYVLSLWGPDAVESPFKSAIHRALLKRVIKKAILIHTDSHLVKWFLIKNFDIEPHKVLVFPFGISRSFFGKEVEKPVGVVNLVTHRKLEKLYGHEVILKAAKILKEMGRNFKLYIASFGSELQNLKRLAQELELDDFVEFTGKLEEDELISLLAKSHIFISSAYSDTTPNSLLEAMALKAFPVLSDLPVYREWILEGLNGLYFRPGDEVDLADKLEWAMENLQSLEEPIRFNRKVAEKLADWDKNFERFIDYLANTTERIIK